MTTDVTREELYEIFSFGDRYGECWHLNITWLLAAIRAGMISMERAPLPPGHDRTDEERRRFSSRFSGKTDAHRSLCADAASMFDARGIPWSEHDLVYPGGRADVSAPDRKIAVECGYTQARKALDGCAHGWTVIVIPYGDPSTMYTFTAEESARERILDVVMGDTPPNMVGDIKEINDEARAWFASRRPERKPYVSPADRGEVDVGGINFEMDVPYSEVADPVAKYLSTQGKTSRRPVEAALARVVASVIKNVEINRFAWHCLTGEIVTRIRDAIALLNSAGTANTSMSAVKGVVTAAEELGIIDPGMAYRIRIIPGLKSGAAGAGNGRVLTNDEVTRIINACDSDTWDGLRNGAVVALLFGAGMRLSEIEHADVSDVDLEKMTVRVRGDRGHERVVDLSVDTVELMGKWISERGEADGPLLTSSRRRKVGFENKPISRAAVSSILGKIAELADVQDVTPADARCTAITRWLASGMNELVVMRLAGHARIETTLSYAIADPESICDAVATISTRKRNPNAKRMNIAMIQRHIGFESPSSVASYMKYTRDE